MKKIIAFISSALFIVALASVVLAHAEIESCVPAIDGTVETAPVKVICKASEGIKPEGSLLKVLDANGAQVDKGDSAVDLNDADRTTISVSLDTAKMKDGVYTVKWTTVSADDGDEESGEFKFTVQGAAQVTATALPQATAVAPATATTAPAVPTVQAVPTTSASSGTSNTLPATGSEVNYGLFALLAAFGLMLCSTGAFVFARARR